MKLTHSSSSLFDVIPPLMRASRKAYGWNSFFQSYIKFLYHHKIFVNHCIEKINQYNWIHANAQPSFFHHGTLINFKNSAHSSIKNWLKIWEIRNTLSILQSVSLSVSCLYVCINSSETTGCTNMTLRTVDDHPWVRIIWDQWCHNEEKFLNSRCLTNENNFLVKRNILVKLALSFTNLESFTHLRSKMMS